MQGRKRLLRKDIIQKLESMPPELRDEKSKAITEWVITLPEWKQAEVVLTFLPMPEEGNTTGLIRKALEAGKVVGLPRMGAGNVMSFHRIASPEGPWEVHPYGVREPAASLPEIDPSLGREEESGGKILVLTPGLAFDRRCGRLGRGKGFYDAYLSRFPEYLVPIGIAFARQIVDEVPVEPSDVPLKGVVTDEGILKCGD